MRNKQTKDFMENTSMDTLVFERFAKGKATLSTRTTNCVIYTRVSTKEQADNNLSLTTQRKACELYAQKSGYAIMGYFGGTYESAKTDERKEFNNMLSFVKKSKTKVSHIIVYSVDRFSRSGTNAMYIADCLKKEGILLFAVTQPADTTTSSGRLQQNIQFIFSEYDNQLRREKCMAGTKEMLLRGEWPSAPMLGYEIVRREGKREIVVNHKGKLIRKAFYWKAKEKISSEEIRKRLKALGLTISSQYISKIFHNPFYCGMLAHNLLDGKVIEGKHEKLISKELFLEVNNIMVKNAHGYSTAPENNDIPLKRFLKCTTCQSYLRGYKAYKNQQYYYKCNTVGCGCNKRADSLHQEFKNILDSYVLTTSEDISYLIKKEITSSYGQLNEQKEVECVAIKKEMALLVSKLERLEERFILEDITKEQFEKYKAKFLAEKKEMEKQLAASENKVSNLDEAVDNAIYFASKLNTLWESSDYLGKQQLQFLLFPDGMYYDKKNNACRTPQVNGAFAYIAELNRVLTGNTARKNKGESGNSPFVELQGIEPWSKHTRHKLSTCLF
jgi:site-specific DNA recombinase